ncbi:MAG: Fibronectin type domain protein, partial [Candidatus Aminicenantes bacterium]|nr:Fibronectin type domain protein [Candidatus Aminicenantes bacterium]
MNRKKLATLAGLALALISLGWGTDQVLRAPKRDNTRNSEFAARQERVQRTRITTAQRRAAAARFKQLRQNQLSKTLASGARMSVLAAPAPDPGGVPHYFGPYPNYANSPLPAGGVGPVTVVAPGTGYTSPTVVITDLYGVGTGAEAQAVVNPVTTGIDAVTVSVPGTGYYAPLVLITDPAGTGADATATLVGPFTGGLHKFVDRIAGLDPGDPNGLGQYIPVAVPDKDAFSGSDYYEIELGQYSEQLHTDMQPTLLRGYRQTNTSDPALSAFHYLGPLIIAEKNRPVRIKFTNNLPTGAGGDLFIPVDTTLMGAGEGPIAGESYTENRAAVHLHGGFTSWISDGTPHQWVAPAGETTNYMRGLSVFNVPDMPDPGDGSLTLFYGNEQSARLMFYHDHALGLTRLNVYAGEAAGYVITDAVEQDLIKGTNSTGVNPDLQKVLPDVGFPLIIQDKSFVDPATIYAQDPTWNWGSTPGAPVRGDMWMPHVYM